MCCARDAGLTVCMFSANAKVGVLWCWCWMENIALLGSLRRGNNADGARASRSGLDMSINVVSWGGVHRRNAVRLEQSCSVE